LTAALRERQDRDALVDDDGADDDMPF